MDSPLLFGATTVPPTCPCGVLVDYRGILCEGCLCRRDLAEAERKIVYLVRELDAHTLRRDGIRDRLREAHDQATTPAREHAAPDPVTPTRCPNCGVGHGALHLDGCAAKGGA